MRGHLPTIDSLKESAIWRRADWLAFGAVTLLALFFRLYRIWDLPPGTFFDPAVNGLDAWRLLNREGGPIIFFPTNGGRESPFMYLLTIPVAVFGTVPLALNLTTAVIGFLTVPLAFGFLRRLDVVPPAWRTQFAAWGGLALAVSVWHTGVSRVGQRPVLVPLLAAALFWAFLVGWQEGRLRYFVLAGLLMGAEGYTYSAARLLPVALTIAVLPSLWSDNPWRPGSTALGRARVVGMAYLVATAVVVYVPMGWYHLTHRGQFGARAFSVAVWAFLPTAREVAVELARNLARTGAMFCCRGWSLPYFGPAGRPVLDFVLYIALLLGLATAAWDSRRFGARLLLTWWVVLLLPTLLTIECPHPLRSIGAIIPTYGLVGLGLVEFARWAVDRPWMSAANNRRLTFLLTAYVALVGGWLSYRAYFVDWTADAFEMDTVSRVRLVVQEAQKRPVYLPLSTYHQAATLYQLSGPFPRRAALEVDPAGEPGEVLLITPGGEISPGDVRDLTFVRLYGDSATLLPPLARDSWEFFAREVSSRSVPLDDGEGKVVAYVALFIDEESPLYHVRRPDSEFTGLDTEIGPFELTGAAFDVSEPAPDVPSLTPGLPFAATLYWTPQGTTGEEYDVLAQLVDDERRMWGDGSGKPLFGTYPTSLWLPDDRIADMHAVQVQPNAPHGRYWLAVSMYDAATGERLPLKAGGDSPGAVSDTVFIGPLKIAPAPPDTSGLNFVTSGAYFGEPDGGISLAAYAMPRKVEAGGELGFWLAWKARARPAADYTVFVHLLDESGAVAAGYDEQPLHNTYPTSIWSSGEIVYDGRAMPLGDLPPGVYGVELGLYLPETGERLTVTLPDGTRDEQNRLLLFDKVEIAAE